MHITPRCFFSGAASQPKKKAKAKVADEGDGHTAEERRRKKEVLEQIKMYVGCSLVGLHQRVMLLSNIASTRFFLG